MTMVMMMMRPMTMATSAAAMRATLSKMLESTAMTMRMAAVIMAMLMSTTMALMILPPAGS